VRRVDRVILSGQHRTHISTQEPPKRLCCEAVWLIQQGSFRRMDEAGIGGGGTYHGCYGLVNGHPKSPTQRNAAMQVLSKPARLRTVNEISCKGPVHCRFQSDGVADFPHRDDVHTTGPYTYLTDYISRSNFKKKDAHSLTSPWN
jgi:hypothetical protein